MSKQAVVGVFSYVDTTTKAVQSLKEQGHQSYTVYMPTYIHDLAEEIDHTESPVRWVTLLGGLVGFACAILMTGWMSLDYPVRTSMKPVLSWPPYTVIMFELVILIGGLFNLGALFGFCKLPRIKPGVGYDPRFTDDKFGVVIEAESDQLEAMKELLKNAGAEEVRDADA